MSTSQRARAALDTTTTVIIVAAAGALLGKLIGLWDFDVITTVLAVVIVACGVASMVMGHIRR
jgi:uncharacterized membrane protein YuzA (DUF378 family)